MNTARAKQQEANLTTELTVDVSGLSKILKISPRSIYARISEGGPMPPFSRMSFKYVWVVADVIEWLRERAEMESAAPSARRRSGLNIGRSRAPDGRAVRSPKIERRRALIAQLEQRQGK